MKRTRRRAWALAGASAAVALTATAAWAASGTRHQARAGGGSITVWLSGTYALFYNKALFRKAGIARPPRTYAEVLADCKKFKAKGILPLAYGDRDGYSTDNWATYDYTSYMDKGDIGRVNDGKLKYTDPK